MKFNWNFAKTDFKINVRTKALLNTNMNDLQEEAKKQSDVCTASCERIASFV